MKIKREQIESLLNMEDPATKSHYMSWDKGDCSEVGLCEILLSQLIREHKQENGEWYDTDFDQIKLRYE
jgi:L-lactate utilization protein LutB